MPVSLTNVRHIIMPALMMTPEERAAAKAKSDAIMAKSAAEERARYDALSEREKAEYDLMSASMLGSHVRGTDEMREDALRRLDALGVKHDPGGPLGRGARLALGMPETEQDGSLDAAP